MSGFFSQEMFYVASCQSLKGEGLMSGSIARAIEQ